tara:strand:- start:2816 stop:3130 length:315 start_codon:yes stop_codon:yes gene_type:complete
MRRLANDEINIIIYIPTSMVISDDVDDFHGGHIDDFDYDTGELRLIVKKDEIDAVFTHEVEVSKTEAWGITQNDLLDTIDVQHCRWQEFDVLNKEDVCYEISAH